MSEEFNIFLLDNSDNIVDEIVTKRPKTYRDLLSKINSKFENLPKTYVVFYKTSENLDSEIYNDEEYKLSSNIILVREVESTISRESLFSKHYSKLSESKKIFLMRNIVAQYA